MNILLASSREKPQFKNYHQKKLGFDRPAQVDTKVVKQDRTEMVEVKVLVQTKQVKEIQVPAEYMEVRTSKSFW